MNKTCYWFLDSAIENVIGFSWIVPNKMGDIGINLEPLNISIYEMAKTMQHLFDEGNMLAIKPIDLNYLYFEQKEVLNITLLSKKGFIPSFSQIEHALKQQEVGIYVAEELYYFLTVKGGDLWEYFSRPRWNMYIGHAMQLTGDIEITSINPNMIKKFLELYHLFNYDSCNVYSPVLDTQKWAEVIPFQYSYWKSLAMGYKVSCKITSEEVDRESTNKNRELLNQRREANNWYRSTMKWYANYYLQ
jgi:hypothetical protein